MRSARLKPMELVFLGTGGAETTPKVGCLCRICQEARRKGGRFVRNGPSVFLAGASVLFDTPEDADKSLEREGIHEARHLVYTHWHPDHTGGRRVLEQLNMDWLDPKGRRVTDVWLPSGFAKIFGRDMVWRRISSTSRERALPESMRWEKQNRFSWMA